MSGIEIQFLVGLYLFATAIPVLSISFRNRQYQVQLLVGFVLWLLSALGVNLINLM
jgi:hypothetical protein